MALCFELVVNFGDKTTAARAAAQAVPATTVLRAGKYRIPLHPPLLGTDATGDTVLSLLPVAVGYGVAVDGSLPRFPLTPAELTEIGHQLYGLLAEFDGYLVARVGWDPEHWLDPADLRNDWLEELVEGSIDGLVLHESLHAELGLGDAYEVFRPGYRWIPYWGE
ncbi:hypothetical protein ACWDR0_05950 [Streptomyces sp. NPDC003691]